MKKAFTLLELMIVIAIMGLMGTLSVGGYRAMRRGMEESGVKRNVDEFMCNAYQRASIDRHKTAIIFWNETRSEDDDENDTTLSVVGRAVAVRQTGRVSYYNSSDKILFDEFADLHLYRGTDSKGENDDDSEANDKSLAMYIYRFDGDSVEQHRAGSSTVKCDAQKLEVFMTNPSFKPEEDGIKSLRYGYKVHGGTWNNGDAYGFEFADLTLPNNYIFGSTYKNSPNDPKQEVKTIVFDPDAAPSGSIDIYALRPGSTGELQPQKVNSCDANRQ